MVLETAPQIVLKISLQLSVDQGPLSAQKIVLLQKKKKNLRMQI